MAWYRRRRRDLPWRRTSDPYAIWVSEIMLQQTRVVAAIPYYERFLARLPDVATLARARIDTVLALWAGLGYYRRARFLHAAAKIVLREGFPKDAAGLRKLPGIGEYTSAAIASIAFGEPVAVVDGNVERLIARLYAAPHLNKREVGARAQKWLDESEPGDFNQAMMEMGATVCTPRSPSCGTCPLAKHCAGRANPEQYPAPKERAPLIDVAVAVGLTVREGRVFLRRRASTELNSGLWDLPASTGRGKTLGAISHGVLNQRLRVTIHAARPRGEGRWFTAAQLSSAPLATSARKCLLATGFLPQRGRGSVSA